MPSEDASHCASAGSAVPVLEKRRCRQVFAGFLLAASCHCGVCTDRVTSVADLPMGCFSYGYQYTPELKNITNPVEATSSVMCQMRCAATPGCGVFAFWKKSGECWLGAPDAILKRSTSPGAISGPAVCAADSPNCNDIPGAEFPGVTRSASNAAWPVTHQQPTNLVCWPRKSNGFPASCENQTVTVLQDTMHGWPGRCEGLIKIDNLGTTETCQTRCFASPYCAVWAQENYTNGDGSLTCWQGMFGSDCYNHYSGLSPPAGYYFRAQRVMHGTFRVLMNAASMQIHNLTKAFGISKHPEWKEGAKACRMTCLSYLVCQYWQYSSLNGCFVEDQTKASVGYPLVNGRSVSMGTEFAKTIYAGEYIQHTCRPGPRMPLPTDAPIAQGTVRPTAVPTHIPKYGEINYGSASVAPEPGTVPNSPYSSTVTREPSPGFPLWASILICVTIALCLGVVGAAVWMTVIDAPKKGSRGGEKGRGSRRQALKSKVADSFPSDSEQSQRALLGNGGQPYQQQPQQPYQQQPQHWWNGWNQNPQWPAGAHMHQQQQYAAQGYGGAPQGGPSHDQLMQYAHQGFPSTQQGMGACPSTQQLYPGGTQGGYPGGAQYGGY